MGEEAADNLCGAATRRRKKPNETLLNLPKHTQKCNHALWVDKNPLKDTMQPAKSHGLSRIYNIHRDLHLATRTGARQKHPPFSALPPPSYAAERKQHFSLLFFFFFYLSIYRKTNTTKASDCVGEKATFSTHPHGRASEPSRVESSGPVRCRSPSQS